MRAGLGFVGGSVRLSKRLISRMCWEGLRLTLSRLGLAWG